MIKALFVTMAVLCSSAVAFAAPPKGYKIPSAPPVAGVVNLNNATLEQLELLPGVGKKRAKAILEYRKQNHFLKVEQVRKVQGVGAGVFKKMQSHLSVSGPTTIAKLAPALPRHNTED